MLVSDKNDVRLSVGDHVRVHTGEEGVVQQFLAGVTKCVHVLFRPGFGGTYFPFECERVSLDERLIRENAAAGCRCARCRAFRGE